MSRKKSQLPDWKGRHSGAELLSHPEIVRAVHLFERAVLRYDELGAIPKFSDDPEEQYLIDKTRAAIKRQYTRARSTLFRKIYALGGPRENK